MFMITRDATANGKYIQLRPTGATTVSFRVRSATGDPEDANITYSLRRRPDQSDAELEVLFQRPEGNTGEYSIPGSIGFDTEISEPVTLVARNGTWTGDIFIAITVGRPVGPSLTSTVAHVVAT